MTDTKKSTRSRTTSGKQQALLSEGERAAMQETLKERRRQARRTPAEERAEGEAEVLAKIAEMTGSDREMAEQIHALVTATAPTLVPRTFYGMPAYSKNGKVVCFFQAASKFKVRYATFGFQPDAALDDGEMWPVAFALKKLTAADKARIAALVKKAAS